MPLNDIQRTLVAKKFEILREVSFGFTKDRLLHLQGADVSRWTDECTAELRREIASAAPPRVDISLLDFPELRCLSRIPDRQFAPELQGRSRRASARWAKRVSGKQITK